MIDYYGESKIKEAWKLFTTKGMLRREVLRPEIAYSWARCQLFGLQPGRIKDTPISPEEYHLARNDGQNILQNGNAFIENFMAVSGYGEINIALSDSRGIVLADWIQKNDCFAYRQGVSILEEKIGTNGAALCISKKSSFVVKGAEHYCESLQTIQSIGIPLYNRDNSLLAVIGATVGMECDGAALLEKLEHLGSLIVGSIHKFSTHQVVEQLKDHYAAALDALPEAVLCFDRYGQILHGNKKAEDLFTHKIMDLKQFNIRELIKMDQPITLESLINGDSKDKMLEGYYESLEGYLPAVLESVSFEEYGNVKVGMVKLVPFDLFRRQFNQWAGNKAGYGIKDIVGTSHSVIELKRNIRSVANSDFPCIIVGEKGTGKKVIVQAIHSESNRSSNAFYTINCGSIPKREIEYILFGRVEDISGNDIVGRMGIFEMADEGTLYLDNISELPQHVQGKLVKYLDTKKFSKHGSLFERKSDVRVFCSCLKDPMVLMEKGLLRQDLYNRLSFNKIETVPLRYRKEDIPMLVDYLLDEMIQSANGEYQKPGRGFYEKLESYDWPGNVRELQKVLQSLVYKVREGNVIDEMSLKEIEVEITQVKNDEKSYNLERIEKEAILKAIEMTDHNLTQASKLLGIGRSTLYRKMERYGIEMTQNDT